MMSWSERIAQAKLNKKFSQEDQNLSGMWNSCAIGERFKLKKDKLDELPPLYKDVHKVSFLGWSFQDAVVSDRIEEAEKLYRQIMALPETHVKETKQE